MNIEFDKYNNFENYDIYLCNPDKKQICSVHGINKKATLRLNSLSELTIEVPKYIKNAKGEQKQQPCYDLLQGKRLILVDKIGYFEITKAVENDSETGTFKTVSAESHQATLKYKTGITTEERVYKFYNSVDPLDDNYVSSDVSSVPSVVGQLNKQLGIQLELQDQDNEATTDYDSWTITFIDDILKYGENGKDAIYRSFESAQTNGYDFMINSVEQAFEMIWIFDFLHHTIKAKLVSSVTKPTDIYLSFDNLVQNIEVSENAENIKTVLNCEGSSLDIRAVNPMGTNYIVNFDYYKDKNGNWMSKELIEALDEWKQLYDSKVDVYSQLVLRLRNNYESQTKLSATIQATQLKINDLINARDQYIMNYPLLGETVLENELSSDTKSQFFSSVFSTDTNMICYKKSPKVENTTFVFETTGRNNSLLNNYNNGYIYFQDKDNKTYCKLIKNENGILGFERYGQYSDIMSWCKCDEALGVIITAEKVSCGDKSLDEKSKYHYSSFTDTDTNIYKCYTKAPSFINGHFVFDDTEDNMEDTLTNAGNANYLYFIDGDNTTYCKIIMSAKVDVDTTSASFYASGFVRYDLINNCTKWLDLQEKLNKQTEEQSQSIDIIINAIVSSMAEISDECNIQKFMLKKDASLQKELESYWIEGKYENTNYKVLDTTTPEEIIDLAKELQKSGEYQLARVSQPSFSITIGVLDFLRLSQFKKFAKQLQLGKTITIEKSSGLFYTPAVTEISLDLDAGGEFQLTFSNSARLNSDDFTFADLVAESSKVTDSLISNWSELFDYSKNKANISQLLASPLDRSLRAGITNMANQEFTIDSTGILGRKFDDDSHSSFSDEQMRIMNNTILFTDDNWKNVKTALGKIYYNVDGVEQSAYGLIAQTIIGDLVMSEALRITNKDSSISLDANGLIIKHGDEIVFNADVDGNLSLVGHVVATSGSFSGRIEALEGYIGSKTSGFTINENSISHNMSDNDTRVLIGTGVSNTQYTVANKQVTNAMLVAGSSFAVTQSGSLYANNGYIADLEMKKTIYRQNTGDYVKINNELKLYSSLEKYLLVYLPSDSGDYVKLNDDYVLGASLNRYNERYNEDANGGYIYADGAYVLITSVKKYNLTYEENSRGSYVKIGNDFVEGSTLTRYSETYQESTDGQYIEINNEYVLGTTLQRYTFFYVASENGIYVKIDDNSYSLLSEMTKYLYDEETETYTESDSGIYVLINDQYELISELTLYNKVFNEDAQGEYVYIDNEYVLYSNLTRYNKVYIESSNGLYVNINGEYFLYSSLQKYRKNYYESENGLYIKTSDNNYILLSTMTRYTYDYDVLNDTYYIAFSSLTKYAKSYILDANGDYVKINNQYVSGEELPRYNSDGSSATTLLTTYGIYGVGFKIETASQGNGTLLAFFDDTDKPSTIITKTMIQAPEAYIKLLSSKTIVGESVKTNGGLVMTGSRISYSGTDASDGSYITFGYSASGKLYGAKLWWNWWERILRLSLCDEWGNDTTNDSGSPITFGVNYACIWGGNTYWSATVGVNSSGTTKDTKAFWGIDYATFSDPSISKSNRYIAKRAGGSNGQPTIGVNGNFIPTNNGGYSLGSSTRKWNNIYATNGSIVTSDANEKNEIKPMGELYEKVFDGLKPVSYKLNDGTSGRTHTGLIADDVKTLLDKLGINTKDFAAYCSWEKEDKTIGCGLRYEEFIALCIQQIQSLKARVKELENNNINKETV